ncbi:glycosyl transferase family 8 [Phlyctema vagabunda]|uniref:Glycosyl transferase family 8 n=1 Tax=Phlyctema vagabunda TaxID=108571 RepID=A0ABR4PQA4_9HELO
MSQFGRTPLALFAAAFLILFWISSDRSSYGISSNIPFANEEPKTPTNNYAFSAFLAAPSMEGQDDNDDLYFVATRLIIYQLLHAPETRTRNSYPFVVLVTKEVTQSKRDRLEKDGAIVQVVEKLSLDWAKTRKAWRDVLTKLRLFEMYQYDKVLFLDSDTLITRPMDDIFDDPAAQEQKNLGGIGKKAPDDEGKQPETYIFAGNAGSGGYAHPYPPPKGNNLNAGCMVFRPSKELFDYYMNLAQLKDRFPGRTPEQSLWSYAHRRDGNMPWTQLHYDWNVNWATSNDTEHGIASLHSKFWELDHDPKLRDYAMQIRWMMEGYWQGVEAVETSSAWF